MMNYDTIVFEKRDGIAKISLNQPDKLNALNTKMITELYEALKESGMDPEVRCIITKGTSPPFIRSDASSCRFYHDSLGL
ncbi:MAG: enoyl-CoA hydratase/isomerase family protein [Candidatus Tectomicrobia bacterium]|uniref:Enoyl-CoA hydratase/isomerase family protein n=1 Tax=Tectimicrobiota bacterium TaxID=2528274 RepID=A0A933GLF8_UNCTE|nr:enoyl-CoA hydratase/isomerase family protein [Candidatus Tectomicrobia bacterium]